MKPTLQLRLGQSLTMTPQLQQAIRLLQLSTLELQQEIQQALENNPLLEQEESEAQETSPEAPVDASQLDSSDAMAQEQMPDELPVDTTWDEVYSAGTAQSAGPIHDGEDSVYQGKPPKTCRIICCGRCGSHRSAMWMPPSRSPSSMPSTNQVI